MKMRLFLRKLMQYIFCAVNYAAAALVVPFVKKKTVFKNLWIISERGIDARDNAYYLFKYIREYHPEINIAYIISSKSADRERVSALGRVIEHGSFKHFLAVAASEVKISTHIMGYTPCINFFVRIDKLGFVRGKKIFLQHGVTKDNQIYLYNDNVNVDLFVCSAKAEYDYIHDNFGYKENVVRLLGMCRYDALKSADLPTKKILVMPTWRRTLQNVSEKEFLKSDYYRAFNELINSGKLNELLEKYNYELLFYPHFEMQPYLKCFSSGGRVKIMKFDDCTVQELLINSDVLITDFSSVFFDYGYMKKPMIFYQFDEASFRKNHYKEGYFDYKRDAFGEIVYDLENVLTELESILQNGAKMDNVYRDRVDKFFTLRDMKNCERNFNAIKEIVNI